MCLACEALGSIPRTRVKEGKELLSVAGDSKAGQPSSKAAGRIYLH